MSVLQRVRLRLTVQVKEQRSVPGPRAQGRQNVKDA